VTENPEENSRAHLPAPSQIVPEVERLVADELPEEFKDLPEAVKKETVRKVSVTAIEASISSWECDGYPPPAILEEYERFSPGFAQKVIRMAEDELKHSQSMEVRAAQYFSRGQWMGFVLAFIVLTGSIWLISIGKEATGGLLAGAVVLPLIGMFIRGQLNIGDVSSSNSSIATADNTIKKATRPKKQAKGAKSRVR
jgi:uncharacterized membrane protein